MPGTVLIGLQWGDEGKGKVIDHLTGAVDAVARFQGGGNAGHTVVIGPKKFILHHLPSGILHPGKTCIIGPGLVLDPVTLAEEVDVVRSEGLEVEGRLKIDYRTHLILPQHRFQDRWLERRRGAGKIGTTGRGIGPGYEDKAARIGLRAGDLLDPPLWEAKAGPLVEAKRRVLGEEMTADLDLEALLAFRETHGPALAPYICDTVDEVNRLLESGREVLFEGAQGTLLDLDLGTYPFVTSSNTTVGGVFHGAGVAPRHIRSVIGVTKAYMTRVGKGAFPTELEGDQGDRLRDKGAEFGSTTGRPRRCGWLDAVAGRYAVRLNGVDTLGITKLDVLSGLEEIRICTGYKVDGERLEGFDARPSVLSRVEPVLESHPGWGEEIGNAGSFEDLPETCRGYLQRLEAVLGARVGFVSVGPERSQIIEMK